MPSTMWKDESELKTEQDLYRFFPEELSQLVSYPDRMEQISTWEKEYSERGRDTSLKNAYFTLELAANGLEVPGMTIEEWMAMCKTWIFNKERVVQLVAFIQMGFILTTAVQKGSWTEFLKDFAEDKQEKVKRLELFWKAAYEVVTERVPELINECESLE